MEKIVWYVVDSATGEPTVGDEIQEDEDSCYGLIDGYEWRRFRLVPIDEET